MSEIKPSYEELEERLKRAEAALDALRRGEVDLVVGAGEPLIVRYKHLVEENERISQMWETTFNATNDAIWILDTEQKILLSNKTAERILGKPREEFIGKHCWEIMHCTNEPIPQCPFLRMRKSLLRETLEMRRDGSWFEVTVDPILNTDKVLTGAVHIVSDITERKQMEEALQKSEELFRNLFEKHVAVKLIIDPDDGRIIDANEAAANFYGWSREELRQMKISDINTLSPAEIKMAMEKVRKNEQVYFEFKHRRADGSIRDVEVFSSPIEIGGKVLLHSIVHDITARKHAEEEREKLQEQLLQSQKLESIGRLAGGVAHNFNNILTAIVGYANIALIKLEKDSPARHDIENILECTDRATYLTKELLLFSRKHAINRQPVELNTVIQRFEKFLRRVIGEDILLETNLCNEPLTMLADSHQLEQVLINLATNARDAMPKGGILKIFTEKTLLGDDFFATHGQGKKGLYAVLTVSDTGIGMNKETLSRIFEPFFTTKEVGKGTGLGMSVVYGIIKQHEGFIDVYSEPGMGTTFKIYLPLSSVEMKGETVATHTGSLPKGTETVLVAEDDATIRELTVALLTEYGYTVIPAVNGEDAVKKFAEHRDRVQLLVFDLIMPKMGGKEAYDEIKKMKPNIKVVFVSGYSPDIVRQRVQLDGDATLLYKPISPQTLLREVRRVLDTA